jgi:hypothetical protein
VSASFIYDPNQPVLTFDDMRLTRLVQQEPRRCASINEYVGATGISVDRLLTMLQEPLERGDVDIEAVGGEVFLHTGPAGRPTPRDRSQVPPNLWEILRREHTAEESFTLWRITRDLEAGGWDIEVDPQNIPMVAGEVALLGLRFSASVVPLLILPALEEIASQSGPLTRFDIAGTGLCALTCLHRKLDPAVTAVRRWMLGRPLRAGLDVLVLEAPRYQPILLTADDGGITPRAVTMRGPASEPAG